MGSRREVFDGFTLATVSYLVMPIKLLPLIGERRGRMLRGADLPLRAGCRCPRGLHAYGEGVRGPQGMGRGQSRRGQREESGGTKGPCAGRPAGERQQHGQERISRGCAGVDAQGVLKGHWLTPPGPGQASCPKSAQPPPHLQPAPKKARCGTGSKESSRQQGHEGG